MGAVKNMIMDLEEKCWDEVSSIQFDECEDISEAMSEAVNIFKRERVKHKKEEWLEMLLLHSTLPSWPQYLQKERSETVKFCLIYDS